METQRAELVDQLSEHGWRVANVEENLEWWADEMWLVESLWSPVGCGAYVTFLVDPEFDGDRRKGEAVWAIMVSPKKPTSRLNTEGKYTLSLGQGWQKRLPELIEHLSTLRK